jgi:hypothetical protein
VRRFAQGQGEETAVAGKAWVCADHDRRASSVLFSIILAIIIVMMIRTGGVMHLLGQSRQYPTMPSVPQSIRATWTLLRDSPFPLS